MTTLDTESTLKPLVSLAVKEYCGLLASFHYSGQCYNPFYTTKNALCVCCTCVSKCVCVACDRTKMLGYHALMCMPNPLVLSHNLPVWLCRFSSASRGLGRAAAQEAGHDLGWQKSQCDVLTECDQILPLTRYRYPACPHWLF